jgi:hypothetical protein
MFTGNAGRAMGRSRFAVGLAVAAASCTAGPAAGAVQCGATDPATKQPAQATLTLDDNKTTPSKAFKRSTKKAVLPLWFSISGCDLDAAEPKPTLEALPIKGSDDIADAISLKRALSNGSDFVLMIEIDPKKFDPGSYESAVIAKAPYLASNSTAISVSRSENSIWKILGWGAAAAVAGLVWLLGLKGFNHNIGLARLLLLNVLAFGAGVYAGWSNWHSQDVWMSDDNLAALLGAAFVATSAGAIATVVAGHSTGGGGGGPPAAGGGGGGGGMPSAGGSTGGQTTT